MLKKGDKAPDFSLQDQDGKTVSLEDFKGKKVVLYFYPKDNTAGCTLESRSFSKMKQKFAQEGTVILGVSKDSVVSHQKFAKLKKLSVTLLSDPEAEVQKKYDVWRSRKFMGKEYMKTVRTTFLINEYGEIAKVWDSVNPLGHAENVLQEIKKKD